MLSSLRRVDFTECLDVDWKMKKWSTRYRKLKQLTAWKTRDRWQSRIELLRNSWEDCSLRTLCTLSVVVITRMTKKWHIKCDVTRCCMTVQGVIASVRLQNAWKYLVASNKVYFHFAFNELHSKEMSFGDPVLMDCPVSEIDSEDEEVSFVDKTVTIVLSPERSAHEHIRQDEEFPDWDRIRDYDASTPFCVWASHNGCRMMNTTSNSSHFPIAFLGNVVDKCRTIIAVVECQWEM